MGFIKDYFKKRKELSDALTKAVEKVKSSVPPSQDSYKLGKGDSGVISSPSPITNTGGKTTIDKGGNVINTSPSGTSTIIGNVNTDKSGDLAQKSINVGSSSRRGGGSSSSSSRNVIQTTNPKIDERLVPIDQQTNTTSNLRNNQGNNSRVIEVPQRDIILESGGAVKYDNVTYHGNAIVPNTGGKTANQLQREGFDYAREQNPDIKKGSYEITIPTEKTIKIDRKVVEVDPNKFKGSNVYFNNETSIEKANSNVVNQGTKLFITSKNLPKIEFEKNQTNSSSVSPPVNRIEKAPNVIERYGSSVKNAGVIQGTLNFVGSETSNLVDRRLQDMTQQGNLPYQWKATTNAVNIAPNLAYFSPIGAPLIVLKGTESLVTPSGRARIEANALNYQAQGINPTESKILAYAQPILEIGLGGSVIASNLLRTGRILGYSPKQQERINQLTSRPNAYNRDLIPGKSNINLKEYQVFKNGNVNSLSGSSRLNQYKISLNTQGLSVKDLKIANKFNLRGNELEVVNQLGNKATGQSVSVIKTGGWLGPRTNIYSEFSGTLSAGKFQGVRYSILESGKFGSLSGEIISGSGNVKNIGDFRIESGIGQGNQFASIGYKIKPDIIEVNSLNFNPVVSSGSQKTLSFLKSGNIKGNFGETSTLTSIKNYQPLAQKGSYIREVPSVYFEKTIPKTIKTPWDYSTTAGNLKILKVTEGSVPSIPSTILKDIPVGGSSVFGAGLIPIVSAGETSQSAYYGKGQYEQNTFSPSNPLFKESSPSLNFKESSLRINTPLVRSSSSSKNSGANILKPKETIKQESKIFEDNQIKPNQRNRQFSKMKLLEKQKQDEISLSQIFSSTANNQTTKPLPPLIPKFSSGSVSSLVQKVKKGEVFEIFGKRFGQDVKIGEAKTQTEAERKLGSFLKGTLGRSGIIKEKGSGKSLSFGDLKILSKGVQFRPAKSDSKRIVQKAKYSLGTGSEKSEIQYFKRKSSKKPTKKKRGFF